ncbi:DUF2332 domain-containing protein [Nocardia sp. CDC159]|uniref:DUF2332 domain-containing protein n=1 Tax=Nocardia pulmonis TaxID=2951408 RepID=A0A9X2J0Z1_9NOCA|nr:MULTISPECIES: DUF2332 domain-containing protein [Nocardia]MCM6777550.1 DUF2332 domain-containing protein [Nocardia pulmonis]MCM6790343.1 DUF2332 domain-containing protein [Nocardia sp. CDC159]
MSLVSHFRLHARACAQLGSPLYAGLLERVARDLADGGPCARALTGYERSTRDAAVPLRFMAAVHALALSGRAPELAAHYPSTGAAAPPPSNGAVWQAFRATVADQPEWIADWLTRPPQTNEVGRAVPLLAGLLAAVDATPLPIRLLELGSSAGLNLRADHFHWAAGDLAWGPTGSPVTIERAWRTPIPPWLRAAVERHPRVEVVARAGCDPAPLDPGSPADALSLRAYVWPDQPDRLARLDGALRLARRIPATVTRTHARDFLGDLDLVPGTLTIVWHSVMRQYVPEEEWRAVRAELARLAAASSPRAAFAHICFEPQGTADDGNGFLLTARLGDAPPRLLARAAPHGIPAVARTGPLVQQEQ